MERHLRILAFLLILPAIGCAPHVTLNAPIGSRDPNGHEQFYTAVAARSGDSKLCGKISSRAVDEYMPDMRLEFSTERSKCYFYAALESRNAKLCDSVKRIVTIPSNQSEVSPLKCREIIQKHQQLGYAPQLDWYATGRYMIEMGYRDEDRYEAEYAQSYAENSVYRFYEAQRSTESFESGVRNLPSYAEPYSTEKLRPANDDEILTQMFAIETALPEYCSKLSPNSYGGRFRSALRNDCFFAIAQHTGRSALCANVGPNASGETYSRQTCETQLKPEYRDTRWSPNPADFPTVAQFVRVLRKLGYPNPFISQGHGNDWNDFYGYLQSGAPMEKRQEFLRRAEALPSFAD
ncbi:MAG TPA: hypothetical protein VF865_01335 [Acidobacteriaceae bacterium]